MSNFQERLYQLRRKTGLKQEDMAKELGIVFRSYRRYECGDSEPTLSTFLQIAEYFRVSLDYLAWRSDDPTGGIQ